MFSITNEFVVISHLSSSAHLSNIPSVPRMPPPQESIKADEKADGTRSPTMSVTLGTIMPHGYCVTLVLGNIMLPAIHVWLPSCPPTHTHPIINACNIYVVIVFQHPPPPLPPLCLVTVSFSVYINTTSSPPARCHLAQSNVSCFELASEAK